MKYLLLYLLQASSCLGKVVLDIRALQSKEELGGEGRKIQCWSGL